ncbi:tryptophan halogenase [Paucibacter sp. KBW04]|uniref:tryptophan halogenase family protein n=1 Tax=Paucibacter sp. KBW04 TaxID=2153361 RepID=UPI000F55D8C3|nr:tryptophan halogenase family protein [Paucibacter sp. KBW04]RQO61827.1 tryptophan halogenase [Paucibacter sp. KBW04]
MTLKALRRIVIVGGGTAGWMCAAALSKLMQPEQGNQPLWQIRVLESDEIGIIGVGEATIPAIKSFNAVLGIAEDDFLRATQGTFKLGIEFVNWGGLGQRYVHGFGAIGQALDGIAFQHHWLRLQAHGRAGDLFDYSINTVAPLQGKFMRPRADMAGSPLAEIAHAFHFDANLYARFLRQHAEQRQVQRTEGRIVEVLQHAEQGQSSGLISGLRLASGEVVEGDFFIDCSGLRALLIEQTLHAGFEDWSHWLPADRAWAVPCASRQPLLPFTRSTAHSAGWQWRIPLQHRTGNGHVFSSAFMEEGAAADLLLSKLDGEALAEPRLVKFRTGRRKQFWVGNCVALGLASGFMEPLESTSIHLIQTAITRLMDLFPRQGLDAADIASYNRQTQFEYERIRDFIILHYKATRRDDSPFWNYCREMAVPDSLLEKMELYRSNGRIYREANELFWEPSWLQVMHGQGLRPRAYHPLADVRPLAQVQDWADNIREVVQRCVGVMPMQGDFIAANCAAPPL